MATILDSFQRADETPLSDGGQWGGDILARSNHRLGVSAKTCISADAAGLGNSASGYWIPSPLSADQSAIGVPGSTASYFQLFVRTVNIGASFNGYASLANASGGVMQIYRYDSGSSTLIRDTGVGWTTGDTIELRVTGTTLAIFKNNVQAGSSVTDSTYSAIGQIGLLLGGNVGMNITSFNGSPFPGVTRNNFPALQAVTRSNVW